MEQNKFEGVKANEERGKRVSRRSLVKGAIAAGVAAVSGSECAPAQTATPGPTAAELATAGRVAGYHYTDAENAQMVGLAGETREQLIAGRAVLLEPELDPAFRFDPLLSGMKYPVGKSSCRVSPAAALTQGMVEDVEKLAFAPVLEQSRYVGAGKIKSTALTLMYLDRLKKYGPKLLCVINLREAEAMKEAAEADAQISAGKYKGPLHGIPWGAKDLLATKDVPTTWGAKPYLHQQFNYDATVVSRLKAAGAILIVKLSMGELAMGDVWFGGRTRTPWNIERGSSGSSAGSGSATAAGLVGFAIGTETLGSIVSPSVVNAVTGLRPTFGRVSRHGAMALSWTMDKIGPICRAVEDCAIVLSAIHGPDGEDRTVVDVPFNWSARSRLTQLKFGIDQSAFDAAKRDAQRSAIYEKAAMDIRGLGIELKPVKLPPNKPEYRNIAEVVINCEGAAAFSRLNLDGGLHDLAQQQDGSWPNIFRTGSLIPAADYINAMRLRHRLQSEMADAMGDLDGFVTIPFSGPTLTYTNLTGHPTLITRCGVRNGTPTSIEFVGGLYKEAEILRLGLAYQGVNSWHKLTPDISKIA